MIDTHVHLNDERLSPHIDEIVGNMPLDGISALINVGYDIPSSELALSQAERYDGVYCAIGVHPHDASTYDASAEEFLVKASASNKCVAIGEIGLDYYYDLSPRETQKEVFVRQLDLAHSLKKPVVIHLRDAYGDMLPLLKANKDKLEYGILLHCYSGSLELLKEFSKLGAYFAYGGAITFKNATEKPSIVRATPMDRLLLETDCPYMTPVPYRGQTNYPRYVSLVRDRVADILSLDAREIDEITTANARRFFNI